MNPILFFILIAFFTGMFITALVAARLKYRDDMKKQLATTNNNKRTIKGEIFYN